MAQKKPLVIVTRKLPEAIETRMMELFDTRLNLDDRPLTQAELAEAMRRADVRVPTVSDRRARGSAAGAPTRRLLRMRVKTYFSITLLMSSFPMTTVVG